MERISFNTCREYSLQSFCSWTHFKSSFKKTIYISYKCFRPRRWKGKIVNDKSKIIITNLDPSKRPISAVADNLEVRNAKSITVKTNNKIKFNLLYDKNRSLQKKLKLNKKRNNSKINEMNILQSGKKMNNCNN